MGMFRRDLMHTRWIWLVLLVLGLLMGRSYLWGMLESAIDSRTPEFIRRPDTLDSLSHSPLIKEVSLNHVDEVAQILSFGVNPNESTRDNNTALHYAAQGCFYPRSVTILKMLIDYYACARIANNQGETALMYLQNVENVDRFMALLGELILHGADINAVIRQGYPLLYRIVESRNQTATQALFYWWKLLLNPQAIAQAQKRAFVLGYTYVDPMKPILEQPIPDLVTLGPGWVHPQTGLTTLMFAVLKGDTQSASSLIRKGASVNRQSFTPKSELRDFGYTPLHLAVARGDIAMIELLLKSKADPNRIAYNGNAPLHMILYLDPLYIAGDNAKMIRAADLIVSAGGRIDAVNARGETIFHVAIVRNYASVFDVLWKKYKNNVPPPVRDALLGLAKKLGRKEILESFLS